MIPTEHKKDILQNGIVFMRTITEAYGSEEGMKLWDAMASVLDPDIKGEIFFALLTGEYDSVININSHNKDNNRRVERIKAIRSVTMPRMGLKEAKDLSDNLDLGYPIKLTIDATQRQYCLAELRAAGFHV